MGNTGVLGDPVTLGTDVEVNRDVEGEGWSEIPLIRALAGRIDVVSSVNCSDSSSRVSSHASRVASMCFKEWTTLK